MICKTPYKTIFDANRKIMSQCVCIRKLEADDFDLMYDLINRLENNQLDETTQRLVFNRNISNANNFYLIACQNAKAVGYLRCNKAFLQPQITTQPYECFVESISSELEIMMIEKLKSILDQ